jgi:hypothetical protein
MIIDRKISKSTLTRFSEDTALFVEEKNRSLEIHPPIITDKIINPVHRPVSLIQFGELLIAADSILLLLPYLALFNLDYWIKKFRLGEMI